MRNKKLAVRLIIIWGSVGGTLKPLIIWRYKPFDTEIYMGMWECGKGEGYKHIQRITKCAHVCKTSHYRNLKSNHITAVCYIIPALPSCVPTVRLKVTVPMSCRLGTVMLTHSSTCPSPSPTVYMRLSNPTTTAVSTNPMVSYFSSQFHKP